MALGPRPRKERLRTAIVKICEEFDWVTASELSLLLGLRNGKLTERHLSPMVKNGILERRYPDNLNHPEQAYRAIRSQPLLHFQS